MKRIFLSTLLYFIGLGTDAQVAQIKSFNAIGAGTPSLIFFLEPAVKSLGQDMQYPTMNAGDIAYSISFKSVRTSGEILMFPCQPDVFSFKGGVDFRISDKVSSINMDPYLKNYWYSSIHFGYESLFGTNIKGLLFCAGVNVVAYQSVKSYDEFTDEKIYTGIAINTGLDFHLSKRLFLSTDLHLLFGNRWYRRKLKVSTSELQEEKGNDMVLSIGMPHLVSIQLFYIIQEFKR